MMFASVYGQDGSVQSLGAVDPTAPGGMTNIVQAAAQAAQQARNASGGGGWVAPTQRPAASGGGGWVQAAAQAAERLRAAQQARSAPTATPPCHFRVPVQTPRGLLWANRVAPCPPGISPGIYVRVPR